MSDGPSRVERILNLLAYLLDARRPITREEIVRDVAGYPETRAAYRRAFERDKETLRAMGVPLRIEVPEGGDPNDAGYRVHPEEYYLPDLGLDPEETAALNVAVNAVAVGNGAGRGALMKLGGLVGEAGPPLASLPMLPALPALFDAYRRRAPVRFGYRGESRTVEPWGLVARRGHWYVVGRDRARAALRTFRVDRVEGEVELGADDDFTPSADFRAEDVLDREPWHFGEDEPVTVRLLVDRDHADRARTRLGRDAVADERADGAVELEVTVVNRAALRSFVLEFLEHAEVLGPPGVRTELVDWLARIATREPA